MDKIENAIAHHLSIYKGTVRTEVLYRYLSSLFDPKDAHITVMNMLNEGLIRGDGENIIMTERLKERIG